MTTKQQQIGNTGVSRHGNNSKNAMDITEHRNPMTLVSTQIPEMNDVNPLTPS